mgnify:CR=1 FL=1
MSFKKAWEIYALSNFVNVMVKQGFKDGYNYRNRTLQTQLEKAEREIETLQGQVMELKEAFKDCLNTEDPDEEIYKPDTIKKY